MSNNPSPRWWLKWVILTIVAVVVILALAILILYLVVKPRNPVFSVDRGSVQGYNITQDGHLNRTNFHLVVRSYNPNPKLSLVYYQILFEVRFHNGPAVGTETLFDESLIQARKNETMLSVNPVASGYIRDPKVAKEMLTNLNNGEVQLDVVVRAMMRFRLGTRPITKLQLLTAQCSPVIVFVSSHREFEGTSCNVRVQNR